MRSHTDIANGCLGTDTLVDFVEGRAARNVRARVEDHASRCGACREELSALARDGTPHAGEPVTGDDDDRVPPGTTIGRYVIAQPIGAGGMGVVYAAHDPELDRIVAVKLLRGRGDPGLRERLRGEAQAMARLAHPHVIAVYDAGVFDDQMFIAMELVEGETLADWLRQPRPVAEILEAYRAAGRGLVAAHEVGIVHRDFKPENVLVGKDGRVRVGDFGLARGEAAGPGPSGLARGSPRTAVGGEARPGALLGTPPYMAPELYRGLAADARSDQFSFCVALFTAIYGVRPFPGDTLAALRASVQAGALRAPREPGRVPRRIRAAIERGLAPDPAARFESMRALLDQLAPRDRHRARWLAATGAVVVALTLSAAMIARLAPGSAAPPCAGASEAFADTWNPARRAAIAAAFTATRIPYAATAMPEVSAALDRYAARWAAGYTEACRATRIAGTQSEALLDLRMACLERRRQEADALIATLGNASPGAIDHALTAALGLVDVAGCADLAALQQRVAPPADPVARARLAALATRYAGARANYQTGAYLAARPLAADLARDARALGYLPFTAEAALLDGEIEHALGALPAEHAALEAALWAAEAGRHDEVAADAWIRLIALVGYGESDFTKALSLVPRATAAIARLGGAVEFQARLELALGALDYKQGKLASAAAHEAAGLALAEQVLGSGQLELAKALESLGTTVGQQGELDRAIRLLERARQIDEAALGRDHPRVANVLHNLGVTHLRRGDLATAEAELRRAIAIRETLGPDYPNLAASLTALGELRLRRGQTVEAIALHRRAVAIADKAWGPDGLELVAPLLGFGVALARAGDRAPSRAAFERAEAIAGKALGPEHPYAMLAVLGRADLLADQAKWREAIVQYERVIRVLEHAEGVGEDLAGARARLGRAYLELRQPARALAAIAPLEATLAAQPAEVRGDVELTIARAMWDRGGDRREAHQLAARALADFRSDPTRSADAARVERWLAVIRRADGRSRAPRAE